ncbi:MAG TPA: GABA permease, partial [Streptosporangiaceae bacterium]|nr:GABA permease [Streptosporangiaceae bacterium]
YGAVALFVYLLIAISQLRLRARLQRESPGDLQLKMWGYPYLSWLTIGGMLAVIAAMGFISATRTEFLLSLLTLAIVLAACFLRQRHQTAGARPELASAAVQADDGAPKPRAPGR